jgi:hypothetical protein
VKYATRLYDAATRAYRRHTLPNFEAVLHQAATALRWAKDLAADSSQRARTEAADLMNITASDLNHALHCQDDPEFHFVRSRPTCSCPHSSHNALLHDDGCPAAGARARQRRGA